MTRFARADGSKSSNKRTFEEATPWEDMKADLKEVKKVSKKRRRTRGKKKQKQVNVLTEEDKNSSQNQVKTAGENIDTENGEKNELCESLEVKPKDKEDNEESTQNHKKSSNPKRRRMKKQQRLRLIAGEDVKTDNYENVENTEPPKQKAKKMKKSSNDSHDENVSSNPKKKKMSLEERKNNFVVENGNKYKVSKKGIKKPWLDLPYEENDDMTRYKNFFVKRAAVPELEAFKKSLEEKGLPEKKITNQMLNFERKLHNKLRLELMRKQIKERKQDSKSTAGQEIPLVKKQANSSLTKGKKNRKTEKKPHQKDEMINKKNEGIKYEENDLMTQFNGYWILKENLEFMRTIHDKKRERIINQRTDGNTDPELTPEEEQTHRRLMKKEKRREESLLNKKLRIMGYFKSKNNSSTFEKRTNKHFGEKRYERNFVARFDGFNVKKEGAERLSKLREQMKANGCTEEEIQEAIKSERRKEEKILKNEKAIRCFRCRGVGHRVSMCPETLAEGNAKGVELCYRCGTGEHMARDCQAKKGGPLTYATCYICGEVGHISRECPDNPRGLYPNDGCCNECGSVEHLKRDCPELQNRFKDSTMKLPRFQPGQAIEELDFDLPETNEDEQQPVQQKQKPKTIKFGD